MKDKDEVNEGWITLHRKIKQHWIWEDDQYFKAWVTILMQVNHEDKKVLITGTLFECKRGQSLMSLGEWVKLFNERRKRQKSQYWTMRKVRTFFDMLQRDDMILRRGVSKTTRLTVCNYDKYQSRRQADDKQTTNGRQQTTIINNSNKQNGEAEPKRNVIHDDTI